MNRALLRCRLPRMSDDVLAQGPQEAAPPGQPALMARGVASFAAGVGALLCALLRDWSYDIILAWPVSFALGVAQLVFVINALDRAARAPSGAGGTRWALVALAVGGLVLNGVAIYWATSHAHGC